jgi:hypothetical protein
MFSSAVTALMKIIAATVMMMATTTINSSSDTPLSCIFEIRQSLQSA